MDPKRPSKDDLYPREIPQRSILPEVPVHPAVPDISLILSGSVTRPSQEYSRQFDVNPSKSVQEPHVFRPPYSYQPNQSISRKSSFIKSSVNDPDHFSHALATDSRVRPSNSSNRMGNASHHFPYSKSYPESPELPQSDYLTHQRKIRTGKPVNDPEFSSVRSLPSGNVIGHVERPRSNEQRSNITRISQSNDPNSSNRMGNASHQFPYSKSYPESPGLPQIDDLTHQKKIRTGKPINDPEFSSVRSLPSGNVIGHVERPRSNEQRSNVTRISQSYDPNSSNRMGNASHQFPYTKSYPESPGLPQIDDLTHQKKIRTGKPVNDPEFSSVRSLPSGNVIGHVERPRSNEQRSNVTRISQSNDPRFSSKRTSSDEYQQQQTHLCLTPEQDVPHCCQKIKSRPRKCRCDLEDSCSSGEDVKQSSNYDQNLQSRHFTAKTSVKDNSSPSKFSSESLLKAQWEINKGTAEVINKLFEVNDAQFQMMHDILVKVTNLQLSQEKFMDELKKSTEGATKCDCSPDDSSKQIPPSKKSKDSPLQNILVSHRTTQTSPGISRVSVGIMTEQPCVTGDYDDSERKRHSSRATKSDSGSMRKKEYSSSSNTKYRNAREESLVLNDVQIATLEQPDPSPQPSLHLDLQEFRESSEEETESNSGPVLSKNSKGASGETSQEPAGAGWTLYNNVLGQVNKYLQSAPSHQGSKKSSEKEDTNQSSSQGQTATSVEGIRYTAFEQIHKLGVSVYEGSAEIKEVSTTMRMKYDSAMPPYLDWQETGMPEKNMETDSNIQKDALALKYLGDDQQNASYAGQKGVRFYSLGQQCTNLSSGTLQYLEKYKLLPHFTGEVEGASGPAQQGAEARRGWMPADEAGIIEGKREASHPASRRREVAHQVSQRTNMPNQTGKILDITKLKKQPKLL